MNQCPVCGSRFTRPRHRKGDYIVRSCAGCGLQFVPAELDADAVASLYGPGYFTSSGAGYRDYVGEEATHRWQAGRYLRRLQQMGVRPGRMLDVGCAAGFFLDEARLHGWEVRGCDVSGYAAEIARNRLGLAVDVGNFLELDYPPEHFDCITCLNVFEHLTDPAAAVRRFARLLRPGGILLLETWDADSITARMLGAAWHQYAPPYVLFYYNRSSLERLFGPTHWVLQQYGRCTKWISVRRGCEILARGTGGRIARSIARVGDGPVGRARLPYAMGDLVLAIYRRRAGIRERRDGPRERRTRARPLATMGRALRHDRRGADAAPRIRTARAS